MRRVLLVGEAPNAATEHRPELWLRPDGTGAPMTHSANRLLRYTGYTQREYLELFERTNLLDHAVASRWPLELARCRAASLIQRIAEDRFTRVVLLGQKVNAAFLHFGYGAGSPCLWHFWEEPSPFFVAFVPHPSGRCRWWNDEGNRALARQFFRRLMESRS